MDKLRKRYLDEIIHELNFLCTHFNAHVWKILQADGVWVWFNSLSFYLNGWAGNAN